MHDWCYTTTTCMSLQWHLPYFVPFKWKCNGAAPYCSKEKPSLTDIKLKKSYSAPNSHFYFSVPGKSHRSDRDSCSHQECFDIAYVWVQKIVHIQRWWKTTKSWIKMKQQNFFFLTINEFKQKFNPIYNVRLYLQPNLRNCVDPAP